MSVQRFDGNLSHSTGQILASWFIANPNGPTAFAIGFTEIENTRQLFYRWMHFTGGNTWLLNTLSDEMDMWEGDFAQTLINSFLTANNFFVAHGGEKVFLNSIPNIVLTNDNPAVSKAFYELLNIALVQCDWGKEIYYVEKYRNNFFARYEEQFRDIYEKNKNDPNSSKEFLEYFWAQHSHRKGFQDWQPDRYKSSFLTDTMFNRWVELTTGSDFYPRAIYNFCQMWVGSFENAKHSGLLEKLGAKAETLDDMLNFFEEYNLPLMPKKINSDYIRKEMGLA